MAVECWLADYYLYVCQQGAAVLLERQERKEKFTLFGDHNRSLLRRQPGALERQDLVPMAEPQAETI